MTDQRNMILAIAMSLAILFGWHFLYEAPRIEQERARIAQQEQVAQQAETSGQAGSSAVPRPPGSAAGPSVPGGVPDAAQVRDSALKEAPRVPIRTKRLSGSISLRGGRVDDLVLRDYKVTIEPNSPNVVLLSPVKSENPYYVEFGWVAAEGVRTPDADTAWTADSDALTVDSPLELSWDNGQGLRFVRTYQVDQDYMFTVRQRIENSGGQAAELFPYGLVSRTGTPETLGFYILHEGPIGVLGGTLQEIDYDDLQEGEHQELKSQGGWLGITDKYWLTALVPQQSENIVGKFHHRYVGQESKYQVDYLGAGMSVPAGGAVEVTQRLFAGAKEVRLLERYGDAYQVPLFDRAVDFGWFWFLTKPLFYVIDYFYRLLGNFGLAILLLTVVIKLIFFPLANKSYQAMSRMKALQPEMMKLRERYGEDRQKMNQELMALYKREKVNPASGCLPILVQIPVFFALYKVLFVTIEMRQAPFYGWIRDLSEPDPTNILTLFGLIPWTPPEIIPALGIWPILMGISMFLQQKLNPQPADPMQARIFLLMPILFTFLLASFPAGLVIYWTWNNLLSMAQQWLIMKRMGVPIGGGKPRTAAGGS